MLQYSIVHPFQTGKENQASQGDDYEIPSSPQQHQQSGPYSELQVSHHWFIGHHFCSVSIKVARSLSLDIFMARVL